MMYQKGTRAVKPIVYYREGGATKTAGGASELLPLQKRGGSGKKV